MTVRHGDVTRGRVLRWAAAAVCLVLAGYTFLGLAFSSWCYDDRCKAMGAFSGAIMLFALMSGGILLLSRGRAGAYAALAGTVVAILAALLSGSPADALSAWAVPFALAAALAWFGAARPPSRGAR